MQVLKDEVKQEILKQAKLEFYKKGFRDASLRRIARSAGMTVGNLYRYFKNKDTLFRELLAPIIGKIEMMKMGLNRHMNTPKGTEEEAVEHEEISSAMFCFIREHRDDLDLLLSGSDGSSLEKIPDELVRWYSGIYKKSLIETWQNFYPGEPDIADETILLVSKCLAAILIQVIKYDYDPDVIKRVAPEMMSFFEGGTMQLVKDKMKK